MLDLSNRYPFHLNRRTWPMFAAGFVILMLILLWADHPLSLFAVSAGKSQLDLFNQITRWGESDWILYPSAALLVVSAIVARLVPKRIAKLALIEMIEIYALIFVGVGLPSLASNLLKRLFGRGRPEVFDQVGPLHFQPVINDYPFQSFPSGHTTTAFAAAMVLGFLSPRWFGLGLLYALAVALSRLVLGAHYPTDVLGGAVLGTLGAYWVRDIFASRRWGFERRPNRAIVPRPVAAIVRLARPLQRKRAR